VVDHSQKKPVSSLIGSAIISKKLTTAPSIEFWKHSPRIWTWPWLGSLFSYTRDPLGFIQKHHRLKVSPSNILNNNNNNDNIL
jgi:hypothetical protein